ncbi:MAG: hypothetical protein ABID64_00330 [Nitrospirota bacterium]
MSLESFIGLDSGEPMSAASLEKLREKMKAASAQIKAIKKEEKKAKKKEYDLLKVLLRFVKSSHKKDLTLLISRVLEINVPANFILTIILLGNKEIQEEVGKILMLNAPTSDEKALTFFGKDETLPLKIKIELDNWIKDMLAQAEEYPQKMVKTGYKIEFIELEKEYEFDEQKYEEKKAVQPALIELLAFVVSDFLANHNLPEPKAKTREFAKFILKGILAKTEESLDQRKLLE